MKILWLGPKRETLFAWLTQNGDIVEQTEERLDINTGLLSGVEWLVSYGYRHILKPDILALFPARAINLHISFLPWNRGADPNLWSFLENTPKGVTVHLIDAGVDTGAILVQRKVSFSEPEETLASSYRKLSETIEALFCQSWEQIKAGQLQAYPQPAGGSFHRASDKKRFELLLSAGWDTPIESLIGKALC